MNDSQILNNYARAIRRPVNGYSPTTNDRLLASVDFSNDTAVSLQGTAGYIDGIAHGYTAGDLQFTAEQLGGTVNAGEFDVTGSWFKFLDQGAVTRLGVTLAGVGATDNATGTGYLMFSEENVHTRFTGVYSGNSHHVIAVQNFGPDQWFYNNNSHWLAFSPTVGDRLLASVDFDNDTAMSLEGTSGEFQGIASGFAQGNLVFTADQLNGSPNEGEFDVSGSWFTVQETSQIDTTATSLYAAQHGTVVAHSDGSFVYTPNSGYTGVDTFTYQVSDGAAIVESEVTIHVVNSSPTASSNRYGVLPGTTLSVAAIDGPLSDDFDPDGDDLTLELISTAANGTLTIGDDGQFAYTPDTGFVGVDEFQYRAVDDLNQKSFAVTVYLSTALVATPESVSGSHDRPLDIDVIVNDHDAFGDPLSVVIDVWPASGILSHNTDGTLNYVPALGFVGTVDFSYHLDNGTHTSNSVEVSVEVTNGLPIAFGSSLTTPHGQTISVDADDGLLARSYDADGDDLVVTITQPPAHGTLNVNIDGSYEYSPTDPNYTGTDEFVWTVTDGLTTSAPATGTVNVTNQVASADDDAFVVHSGVQLIMPAGTLTQNDYDLDGDVLTAEVVVPSQFGALSVGTDGSFIYIPHTTTNNQSDSFTYRLFDGVDYSEPATVRIEIENSAPNATSDTYRILHDNVLSVSTTEGILANDFDTDDDLGSPALITDVSNGSLTLNADGSFDYTPAANWSGTDSFTYRLSDAFDDSVVTTVEIHVSNIQPVSLDDERTTNRNSDLTIVIDDLLANDGDADDDTLTLIQTSSPSSGTLVDNFDGTWTYSPNAGYVGTDSLTYVISDGVVDSSPATISIDVVNAAPEATEDRYAVIHDRQLVLPAGDLFINDYDLDQSDSINAVLVDDVSHGTLQLDADGGLTYTPESGFVGRDSFTYYLDDGFETSDTVRVTLDVENSRPELQDGWQRVVHDTPLAVTATSGLIEKAIDRDDDSLVTTLVSDVSHGTLTIANDGGWNYTPDAGFAGTDSFTYRVADGVDSSTVATMVIEVTNTPVVASLDYYTLDDGSLTVAAPGILQNDSDIDQDTLTLSLIDDVHHGSLTLNADGSFAYTANGNSASDSFTYSVSDGVTQTYATVMLRSTQATTTNSPQAPDSRADFYTIQHSTELNLSAGEGLLANDTDANGDAITVAVNQLPGNGTLTVSDSGAFIYMPDVNNGVPFVGTDTFTYTATDDTQSAGAETTVTINVTNAVPTTASTAFRVHHGQSVSHESGSLARLIGNTDGDTLVYSVETPVSHGTLTMTADGNFEYTPDVGFHGEDSFTYVVNDGVTTSNPATVTIDVTNESPTVFGTSYRVQHDQPLNVVGTGVLSTAIDKDSDQLQATLVTQAANGTVNLNADGSFVYTPEAGFTGTDTFEIQASDGAESSETAVFTIEVENAEPTAFATSATVHQGQATPVILNSFDSDGDAVELELVSDVSNGSLEFDSLINDGSNGQPIRFAGNVTYTPAVGYSGDDEFTYRASDGVSFSETATATIDVGNIAPVAGNSTQRLVPGETLVVPSPGLLGLAFDGDGDATTFEIIDQPANGTLTLEVVNGSQTGGYSYEPNAGFAGTDSFTWKVGDGSQQSDSLTVTLDVGNTVPQANGRGFNLRHADSVVAGGSKTFTIDLAEAGIGFDADQDQLTWAVAGTPAANGTASVTSAGVLTYSLNSDTYLGDDTITLVASDPYSSSDPVDITVSVTNVTPVASADSFAVHHSDSLTLTAADLLGNDFDFDGQTVEIVNVTAGTQGTLTPVSSTEWSFDPNGFVGDTVLTYSVTDGVESSTVESIYISVTNTTTWAVSLPAETNNGSATFDLLDEDSVYNPDGDDLQIQIQSSPSNGTLTPTSSGSYVYTRNSGFVGSDSFSYVISDGVTASELVVQEIQAEAGDLSFDVDGIFGFNDVSALNSSGDGGYWFDELQVPVTYHESSPHAVGDRQYTFGHNASFDQSQLNVPQPTLNDYDPDGGQLFSTAYVTSTAGKRSRRFDFELLWLFFVEFCTDGLRDELEGVDGVLFAGRQDGQDRFHVATSV